MTRKRAAKILAAAARKKILVVGDLILDEFLWGDVERISPEAPVPVVRVTGQSWHPGGAANVARNLREFTSRVAIAGLVGIDDHGRRLHNLLHEEGIDAKSLIAVEGRVTTVKTRIVARHQQVVRVDREKSSAPDKDTEKLLLHAMRRKIAWADGIIVADYAKGLLQPAMADLLAAHKSILAIDPSPANPLAWRNATAIKPNRAEARHVAGTGAPEDTGTRLLKHWDTKMVLLTLGEEGMMLFERGAKPYHTPARAREVFDVSGAGDTAIAIFTLALSAGAEPREAAELANAASGVVVGKLGTAVVTPDELLGSIA